MKTLIHPMAALGAAALTGLALVSPARATIILDDFTDGDQSLGLFDPGPNTTPTTSALGNSRTITNFDGLSTISVGPSQSNSLILGSIANLSTTPSVIWDGPLGSLAGINGILVDFGMVDAGTVSPGVSMSWTFVSGGDVASVTESVPDGTIGNYLFDLSALDTTASPFTAPDSVRLQIAFPEEAADVQINRVKFTKSVPDSGSTAALLGLGLVVAGVGKRFAVQKS
ncbi:MAG: VPDSG-CTERM sorting domain-containing protein [Akkermansiaceae bacterium]|nr:VPDSG-CTERM sorting domain-containing protein [Akkermansiaceae bacterium]NNM30044.1 VPDSG-CTERM sorting domain-containing protein [Akkermansiaceae bacterium]